MSEPVTLSRMLLTNQPPCAPEKEIVVSVTLSTVRVTVGSSLADRTLESNPQASLHYDARAMSKHSGRHGAMNPAGRVGCNCGLNKVGDCNLLSKARFFCLGSSWSSRPGERGALWQASAAGPVAPRRVGAEVPLGHDAPANRIPRCDKSRPVARPVTGRGAYAIRVLPDLCLGIMSGRLEFAL
jgi:hypothetical protein